MRFQIVTLFPEFFDSTLKCGLLGKAVEKGLIEVSFVNPRDFARDKHKSVDDKPYGGGPGMVMSMEPMLSALNSLDKTGRLILLTPKGYPLDQAKVREFSEEAVLTVICGRYEGIDARLEKKFPRMESLSVGDFVLNGGEAAMVCLLESVSRLLPQFMGKEESADEESFSRGLLEYPHYTRPEIFEDLRVPEVLLSGDHPRIAQWRREQALLTTLQRRPELLQSVSLTEKDMGVLKQHPVRRLGRNLYVALIHYPVRNKRGKTVAVSLTNLDIHDIGRVSRSYGLGGYYLVTPLKDQQLLAKRLLDHWSGGSGKETNPHRADALSRIEVAESLDHVIGEVERLTGMRPFLLGSSAGGLGSLSMQQVRDHLQDTPVLLLLGTASGLSDEVMNRVDGTLRPLRFLSDYNHLSVRSAASIMVDRILGDVF